MSLFRFDRMSLKVKIYATRICLVLLNKKCMEFLLVRNHFILFEPDKAPSASFSKTLTRSGKDLEKKASVLSSA